MKGQQVADFKACHTWQETGIEFNCTPEAARSLYRRWADNQKSIEARQDKKTGDDIALTPLNFLDKKNCELPDWRDITEAAQTLQGLMQSVGDTQRTAAVEVKTDKPFAVIYTGDWHFGDGYTDHKTWRRDIGRVIDHPRVKMVDLGDDRQNARAFNNLSVVLEQVIPPKLQAAAMESLVNELTESETLLAKVDGNHDVEFDERLFGEALQAYLLRKMKAPRFVNRGILKIVAGDQTYTNLLFHKSRFRSFVNAVHGAKREYQLSFPADIVAGGHDHEPGFELYYHYVLAREMGMNFGGTSFLMKCGSYQDSAFGWKYFHNGGAPYNFGVIFWPDHHEMMMIPTIERTIDYLDKL